ncbi:hypothetical protein I4U23_021474 [Adineta vaga]|nr:hypothetical protein I4U23_021474 [Adineta vaga]
MALIFSATHSYSTCFEDLPNEILLSIYRYLSPINVLDSLLNLNKRINQTIISYREKIYFSHLSLNECFHLLNNHLPNLASNVSSLYIDTRSMLNIGRIFEEKFYKIDQQFPLLRHLIFRQIDIETLENLSWRFNTMLYLHELDIDIDEDRATLLPSQFNEFLCGKLFSISNTFQILKLNFTNYYFNLQSIKTKCLNLRQLTISIKTFDDLLIIFEYLSNLERLNVTISCDIVYNEVNNTYSFEQLWWKVPYLTHFSLNIEQNGLFSHDYVIPHEIILKIIANIYSLVFCQFHLDLQFRSSLSLTTTREVYINKYFPYVDGSLWQQALQRHDNHLIHFELHVELDGIGSRRYRNIHERDLVFVQQNNDIDFNSLLKSTFSSVYWLQKNINIQCIQTDSKHISIYTIPLTISSLSTIINTIEQTISVKTFPLNFKKTIQTLRIHSDIGYQSSKLSLKNLFIQFPYLNHLHTDVEFVFPPSIIICSNYLHSISLKNYALSSCCILLDYLPNVKTLSLSNVLSSELMNNSSLKIIKSINRLKIILTYVDVHNLTDLIDYFPKLEEFYLVIQNATNRLSDDYGQYKKFDLFLQNLKYLHYIEMILPSKQESFPISQWKKILDTNQTISNEATQNGSLILKSWC